jgi:hypothetical protein
MPRRRTLKRMIMRGGGVSAGKAVKLVNELTAENARMEAALREIIRRNDEMQQLTARELQHAREAWAYAAAIARAALTRIPLRSRSRSSERE